MTENEPQKRPSSEERNAAVRATIAPLAPGERPRPLKAAVAVCLLLALGNVVTLAAGVEVTGENNPAGRALGIAAVLLLIAGGMWVREAVAVLVFEALLIVTMLFAFLGLLSGANAIALLGSTVTFVLSGWLFWTLIRVLARIQAPTHDDAQPL